MVGISDTNRFIDDGVSVLCGDRRAVVLAGGVPQIRLVENLQARGYSVAVVDYYENPPARRHADVFFQESTLDVLTVERITLTERVDILVTCCTDQALAVVSEVSGKLGLPCYVDSTTGLDVTNKMRMKRVFVDYGIPTAKYVVVGDADNSYSVRDISFPCIVKPADCNSSKGVVKCIDEIELDMAVRRALKLSRTHTAIVEEFIDGRELSVDALVCDGKVTVLCISRSDKIPTNNTFVIERGFYSKTSFDVYRDRIELICQSIVDAFRLKNCPLIVQLLERDGKLYVVEFSSRTGGCTKYRMIELACGVDVIDAMVDFTLGIAPKVRIQPGCLYVVDEFVYCREGVFDLLFGFDDCANEGLIYEYHLLKERGSHMSNPKSSGDRIAAITFTADSQREYIQKRKEVAKRIAVFDIRGNDIMRHDLFDKMDDEKANLPDNNMC